VGRQAEIPLFEGLTGEEIARLVSAGRVRSLREGERVLRAGDVGQELYVVLSGSVRAEAHVGGARQVLAQFERGQLFGELAFLSNGARTADVLACEDVRVLDVSRAFLEQLQVEMPGIAARLLFNLCLVLGERLQSTTRAWLASEYERTLALFEALAAETTAGLAFQRFGDAVARAFPAVLGVRYQQPGRVLAWPDPFPDGLWSPPAGALATLERLELCPEHGCTLCPVEIGEARHGVLLLHQRPGTAPGAMDLGILSWVSTQLGLVLDRITLFEETRALATTDGLTGLFNRTMLDRELERELGRVQRYGTELSLLVADLDHFKQVNDRHGHLAGDECLRAVAATLKKSLRQVDLVCRYGGEEFAVIAPMTDDVGALKVAERLRSAIEGLPILAGERELRITISVGIASYRSGENAREFFARADQALYAAKAAGRNRIVAA
jgi:diguanylate cyclase (GGDEF)-like protein